MLSCNSSQVIIATHKCYNCHKKPKIFLGSNVNPPITDPWMAPEATATDKPFYGHAADVYGFGLIAIYLRSVHIFTKQF